MTASTAFKPAIVTDHNPTAGTSVHNIFAVVYETRYTRTQQAPAHIITQLRSVTCHMGSHS